MVAAAGSYAATAPRSRPELGSCRWSLSAPLLKASYRRRRLSNLTAAAASVSQINLSWTASTSSVGLANYLVERCQGAGCANFAQIATPAGTTYADTGLTTATSYSYRVRAIDTAGNLATYSNVAGATTLGELRQLSPTCRAITRRRKRLRPR